MAKLAHIDVVTNGPALIRTAANVLHLVPAATARTVAATTAASLLSASMSSGDYTISGTTTAVLTVSVKTATAAASSSSGVSREWRFCDATRVLWTTDETSGGAIVSGTEYTTPALQYSSAQPV
jgi:hypothetical protein